MLDKIARVAKFGRWPPLAISTSMIASCGAGPDVASRRAEATVG